ncbi:MAG: HNH endonuclease [Caloramator sp.]|uniref:Putative HNH nuclease YajD n=1 Tax=Caloramator proteoclasticus DSM 10124 TaxID=1121262 RepID=A0A1M5BMH3_9CLOT|nr:HNH endonuclease signature motif containing protein [Caloramator proteoclasticus]GIW48990.1 MAG: HNH endonuclease [Caloramator sp.]SHF43813.1 5-methylcytosine-specific restriction enzyme A [Caloramator proteoclasticus DSM 10124]
MQRKPKRPCSYPGCPELTDGRYCEKHEKEIEREYNRNNRTYKYLYNTARWKRLRIKFLKEHPLCEECKRNGVVTLAEVVDHIIPHKGNKELFWDEENLQALCKECHDSKTAKEDGRWGRKDEVYEY